MSEGTVLVIDDDPSMGETVVDILALRDIHAEAVTSGAAALARRATLNPAVAIVDHRLPDMTGIDLCGELKAEDGDLSVILLTGYASLESAIAAVRHVDEYLTKPVHPEELLRAVVAGIERALLRRRNRALIARVQEANASLEANVALRTHELGGLVSVAEAAAASGDLAELVSTLVQRLAVAAGAEAAALYLSASDGGGPQLAATWGADTFPDRLAPVERPSTPTVGGAVPLVAAGEDVGTFVVRGGAAFSPSDHYIGTLAAQAAVAVQNMVRLERERETVERLSELSRLKSSFLASVSHELRTPLAAVLGFAQMLAADPSNMSPAERTLLAGRVVNQAEKLRDLIEDLLDASRLEFGGFRVATGPVVVADVLRSVAGDGLPAAERVTVTLPNDLPPVVADAGRLGQVLGNLVHNALKYSPPGSPIEVTGVHEGGCVVLAVRDHGGGIDPAFLDRIFDPFSQADLGDTRRDSGLGLGLYVSRGLVEAMGGTISVRSETGLGSTFEVRLQAVG